jgi:hypothetical protein
MIKRRYILAEGILRGSYPYRHHTDRHGPLRKKYATKGSALVKREQFSIELVIKQIQKLLNNKNENQKESKKFHSFPSSKHFSTVSFPISTFVFIVSHTISIF